MRTITVKRKHEHEYCKRSMITLGTLRSDAIQEVLSIRLNVVLLEIHSIVPFVAVTWIS